MDEQYFTQKQFDDLTKAIADSYEPMGVASDKFCKVWPDVEEALSTLQGILALVPGVSALAGPAVGIVRAAGGAASKAVCAKK